MNPDQFATIVRMRWRMMLNQLSKSGKVNLIITLILLAAAAVGSVGIFVIAVGWGGLFLGKVGAPYMIYVWDAIALLFLFFWATSLMVELQRSELLSLKNLLHLPVSLFGAFFLNYTSSFASLSILLFLPAMLGLCVASVIHFGVKSLVVFALLASFLLMVTAVSYQLRGWLAQLMENKRKRGTVMAITTITFVMLFQIPNLLNMAAMRNGGNGAGAQGNAFAAQIDKIREQQQAGELDAEQYNAALQAANEQYEQQREARRKARADSIYRTAKMVNASLPIGWLPYGAGAAAGGAVLTPWLCVFGMTSIGCASLAMACRSTLRTYTGAYNKTHRAATHKKTKALSRGSLLEKSVPLLSQSQSAIAMATLCSTLRAPEAKMALLTPLIFAFVFGGMLLTGSMNEMPAMVRPWMGVGAVGVSLFGMAQLMLNMFGLDRQGFRAYVLSPAPRRDILIGKNLGILPLVIVLSTLLVVLVGVVGQVRLLHLLATMLQALVAFLVFFPVSNFISTVAPIGFAAGTMKPVSMKLSVVLVQLAAMFLMPLTIIPAAFALGVEQIADAFFGVHGVPIYLLLTLLELPLAMLFYRQVVTHQGAYLQQREQAILEVVTKVAD